MFFNSNQTFKASVLDCLDLSWSGTVLGSLLARAADPFGGLLVFPSLVKSSPPPYTGSDDGGGFA